EVYANLRPEDKLDKVAQLSQTQGLAMVGDGINDAPALARATVGISMGRIGSATAVDASDVVLLNDDLHLLSWLFHKAKKTQRIVKQNLTLSLGVIALATTPALLGLVPLWLAVILHEGGTVLVGLNSLRLLRK
ncbi:MAG TPA: HAD-IC family P-type ATPase, partial [Chlamydiales bacterium]|nr:HAD-IC family P-type ATPase [Chlamydiales bacterium]